MWWVHPKPLCKALLLHPAARSADTGDLALGMRAVYLYHCKLACHRWALLSGRVANHSMCAAATNQLMHSVLIEAHREDTSCIMTPADRVCHGTCLQAGRKFHTTCARFGALTERVVDALEEHGPYADSDCSLAACLLRMEVSGVLCLPCSCSCPLGSQLTRAKLQAGPSWSLQKVIACPLNASCETGRCSPTKPS
jgi:hypothetical protein